MKWSRDDDDALWGLFKRRVHLRVQALVLGRAELEVARRVKKLKLAELAKRMKAQVRKAA